MNAENTNDNCKNLPLHYVERIALNKGGIACLDGRVGRVENDIRERYTKNEVNCMVAGKADKCAFEKHLLECHKCCKPVCDCNCYTKDEVDALLENKANKESPELTGNATLNGNPIISNDPLSLLSLPISAPYTGYINYVKTSSGIVYLTANIQKDDPSIETTYFTVATMPVGYRPFFSLNIVANTTLLEASYSSFRQMATNCFVSSNGEIGLGGLVYNQASGIKTIAYSFSAVYPVNS